MCQHNEFKILYYKDGFIIRECIHCKQIEVKTEGWVTPGILQQAAALLSKLYINDPELASLLDTLSKNKKK